MESSTEVGKERGPLAPWSVRFGCLRREPRRTGQLGGAYESSVGLERMTSWQRLLVTGNSGSRPAALETALRGQEPPTSRSGIRWSKCESGLGRWGKKNSRRRNQRGRSGAVVSAAYAGAGRRSGVVYGVCVCVCDITAMSWDLAERRSSRNNVAKN